MQFPTNVTELAAYITYSLSRVNENRTITDVINAYRGPLPFTNEMAILFVATAEATMILDRYDLDELVSKLIGGVSAIDEQYVEKWLKGLVDGYGNEEDAFTLIEDSITAIYRSGN